MIKLFRNFYKDHVLHYNHEKYWSRRSVVVDPFSKCPRFIKYIYLLYLRKMDSFNSAEIATGIGKGASFKGIPILPHGIKGIIIHPSTIIGENCTIHQQVTIGTRHENDSAVIGNNVKIGANAVVIHDVPDNCSVGGVPAVIINR